MPVLVAPQQGSKDGVPYPSLEVRASDPDGGSLTVEFWGRVATPVNSDFTLIIIPDTQKYSAEISGATFAMWQAQTEWIVAQRESRNIVYVAHMGDCVEDGSVLSEWQNFEEGIETIEDPVLTNLPEGIPYGLAIGNHDQDPLGNPDGNSTQLYNEFFGVSRFAGRSYYGGNFSDNNDNHFDLFSAGGEDYVVIYLEYDSGASADDANLAWANSLLLAYSNRRGIVVRHELITSDTLWRPQGQITYMALRANPNLFLMLCGHRAGEAYRTDTYNGNPILTVLQDYQTSTNGGNGYLRIYTFSPQNGQIHVQTYSPYLDRYETDSNSDFTLPFSPAPSASESAAFQRIAVRTGVTSGSTASATWQGLSGLTDYEWYATVSDGQSVTTGPIWRFETGPAYTLTLNTVGGGTVTASPARLSYTSGETVSTSASPAPGFAFAGWSDNLSGSSNPAQLVMNSNKVVTGTFVDNQAPFVQVLLPDGGERLQMGVVADLTWFASDNADVAAVDLELSRTGPSGPFESLATGLANSGSYAWLVAPPATTDAYLRVRARDTAGNTATDLSSAAFEISGTATSSTVAFEQSVGGTSTSLASVSTDAPLAAQAGNVYLAAVSSKPYRTVLGVEGLGLTWSRVDAQCGARSQTGVEVWAAEGTPNTSSVVTATFSSAPSAATLAASRYSNASMFTGAVSANTLGVEGDCSGGTDQSSYSLPYTTSTPGALLYAAVALRARNHEPGAAFVERTEIHANSGGNAAGVAVLDATVASPAAMLVSGTFSSMVDWAAVAVEIRPVGVVKTSTRTVTSLPEPPVTVSLVGAPNPFNPVTTIRYGLPDLRHVRLVIFDVAGRRLRVLVDEEKAAGFHEAVWTGTDQSNAPVASGVYFAVVQAGDTRRTLKLLLAK